jgi:hypothetical protein
VTLIAVELGDATVADARGEASFVTDGAFDGAADAHPASATAATAAARL